jgi:hypothetical protein
MFRSTSRQRVIGFLAMICIASPAIAADHRDGPRVTNLQAPFALDLNDLYVFTSPAQPGNTVLILTTGGLNIGITTPPFFLPGAVYEIRVSNDGVKTNDELVFQFVFSDADGFGRQNYVANLLRRRPTSGPGAGGGRGAQSQLIARGVTGQRVAGSLQTKIQAGLFDDPFFFDSNAFGNFRDAVQAGASLEQRVAAFLRDPPRNPFNGNTLAIVMELPRVHLQSTGNNPNISVWLRSVLPNGVQFDRTGLPAINTATLFALPLATPPRPNVQDLFNDLSPAADLGLIEEAAQRINLIYGLPLPQATQLARVVLPDVMPFNTTNTSGFLNGRRLADDVIDAELGLLTGGALTSDRVGNDSVFLNQFPYLAAPKPPPAQ